MRYEHGILTTDSVKELMTNGIDPVYTRNVRFLRGRKFVVLLVGGRAAS